MYCLETNTGNFFFVADGKLMTSGQKGVLGGVTRATILELAASLGIEAIEGDFTPYDVYAADEAFVTSTSPVILPVNSLNGAGIGGDAGNPLPGPVTLKLMRAFFDLAGLDFVAQALQQLTGNEAANGLARHRGPRRSVILLRRCELAVGEVVPDDLRPVDRAASHPDAEAPEAAQGVRRVGIAPLTT